MIGQVESFGAELHLFALANDEGTDHAQKRTTHQEVKWGVAQWKEHITINPAVCHGRACIRGTRVMVSVILDNLAAGVSDAEILRSYPAIQEPDIQAALAYAAELAREGTAELPLEHPV